MNSKNPRLLIVEDEEIVAIDVEMTLKSVGFDVIGSATSGEEAIQCMKKEQIDLVIMDVRLEGETDGIVTADIIRKLFKVPVIFLTAFSDMKTLDKAKVTQPYGYIVKPYNAKTLVSNIEMALYKHKRDQEIIKSNQWFTLNTKESYAGMMFIDREGLIIFVDQNGFGIINLESGDILGRPIHQILLFDDEEAPAIVLSKVINGGISHHLLDNLVFLGRNDKKIPVIARVSSVRSLEGNITGNIIAFAHHHNKNIFLDDSTLEDQIIGIDNSVNGEIPDNVSFCPWCDYVLDSGGNWHKNKSYPSGQKWVDLLETTCPKCLGKILSNLYSKTG